MVVPCVNLNQNCSPVTGLPMGGTSAIDVKSSKVDLVALPCILAEDSDSESSDHCPSEPKKAPEFLWYDFCSMQQGRSRSPKGKGGMRTNTNPIPKQMSIPKQMVRGSPSSGPNVTVEEMRAQKDYCNQCDQRRHENPCSNPDCKHSADGNPCDNCKTLCECLKWWCSHDCIDEHLRKGCDDSVTKFNESTSMEYICCVPCADGPNITRVHVLPDDSAMITPWTQRKRFELSQLQNALSRDGVLPPPYTYTYTYTFTYTYTYTCTCTYTYAYR